jgi:hypothetical protein
MYFPRRTAPLHLTAERLGGLRLSLNTPVIATEELPVGPARAAIAVHEEPDGRPNLTVGVHSLKSGAVVLYSYDGDLRQDSSLAVGLDAALSFAESMGFLFDDDEVGEQAGDAARERAYGLWCELMSAAPSAAGSAAAAAKALDLEDVFELSGAEIGAASPNGDEILVLDDALEIEPPPEADAPAPAPAAPRRAAPPAPAKPAQAAPPRAATKSAQAAPPTPPREPVLTKFRPRTGRSGAAAPPDTPPAQAAEPAGGRSRRKAALGRLRLVKRKRGPQGARESWIQRLFTSF